MTFYCAWSTCDTELTEGVFCNEHGDRRILDDARVFVSTNLLSQMVNRARTSNEPDSFHASCNVFGSEPGFRLHRLSRKVQEFYVYRLIELLIELSEFLILLKTRARQEEFFRRLAIPNIIHPKNSARFVSVMKLLMNTLISNSKHAWEWAQFLMTIKAMKSYDNRFELLMRLAVQLTVNSNQLWQFTKVFETYTNWMPSHKECEETLRGLMLLAQQCQTKKQWKKLLADLKTSAVYGTEWSAVELLKFIQKYFREECQFQSLFCARTFFRLVCRWSTSDVKKYWFQAWKWCNSLETKDHKFVNRLIQKLDHTPIPNGYIFWKSFLSKKPII